MQNWKTLNSKQKRMGKLIMSLLFSEVVCSAGITKFHSHYNSYVQKTLIDFLTSSSPGFAQLNWVGGNSFSNLT